MRVIKFGGTSVGNINRFRNVVKIIGNKAESGNIIVVISAVGGVTDRIIAALNLAQCGSGEYQTILKEISKIHNDLIAPLVRDKEYFQVKLAIDSILKQLERLLRGIFLLKECSPRAYDSAVSVGEYLSKCILVGALNSCGIKAEGLDAVELIKTNSNFGNADVDFDLTDKLIKNKIKDLPHGVVPVINGFTGSNSRGEITTLGRSGSDYTASIIAGAVNAGAIEIWTDVDGILSADPRIVPEAETLSELSYGEAAELAYLGAKVIFPKAMAPAEKAGIPILVLNTFHPENQGTLIREANDEREDGIKAVTCLRDLSLLCFTEVAPEYNLVIISRLFLLLSRLEFPAILLSQSASNQSVCFVTVSDRISVLMDEIRKEFKLEIETGKAGKITSRNDVAVISVVGRNLDSHSPLLGKIFETLDGNQIKSLLFSNSSSHKSVSFVIENQEVGKTVASLHEMFFKKNTEVISEKVNRRKINDLVRNKA